MRIKFWGTRGSIAVSHADVARHGGATTCIEVELGPDANPQSPERVIFDLGTGVVGLGRAHFDLGRTAVFQTHLHWDHIQGFPFFASLFNPKNHLDFYAVPREGHSLRDVLEQQMTSPTFPIGLDALPCGRTFHDVQPDARLQLGDVRASAAEMSHPSGSTAWRLDHQGFGFVFSGDCEVQAGGREALVTLAKGADVLVMDAQYFPDEYETRRGWGHSTAIDAVEVAIEAGVGQLVLTHHDPAHNDARLDEKLAIARRAAGRRIWVENGFDGMVIDLANVTGLAV